MRGPETAQFGMTLSLLARYYNYTRDAALLQKHRTKIGRNVFVGTHATLIAPVKIGDGAFIAAGSPINQDVPEDSLAIHAIIPEAGKWHQRNT